MYKNIGKCKIVKKTFKIKWCKHCAPRSVRETAIREKRKHTLDGFVVTMRAVERKRGTPRVFCHVCEWFQKQVRSMSCVLNFRHCWPRRAQQLSCLCFWSLLGRWESYAIRKL